MAMDETEVCSIIEVLEIVIDGENKAPLTIQFKGDFNPTSELHMEDLLELCFEKLRLWFKDFPHPSAQSGIAQRSPVDIHELKQMNQVTWVCGWFERPDGQRFNFRF